ncbi:bifunctional phosphoribosylaminoimidazolecarboxamide formyltransferase/IMP cyclohydrolase [Dictyobacter arantiisoli]|uniref:Bifunctional purine biosynthesis protein PurH n=1 Tax=Dictyobacter arantiisoli TaxID=2014874 RepID=A0A5A5T827_9CHLR|nr:bifunctional phosphoribosylaminoimidazolecarboxamide formyltransferase/IMP cyclohydrolase [Dictyobacter arantiisoli]GCF07497.1 bifunctional purine biosynthesis protein PurH [Dictyobacter arantiisoli]
MKAILSVANREGLPLLAQELRSHHVTIFSTSDTQQFLWKEGIESQPVSTLTQFPEILDGCVKTLHPAIFGGILAHRGLPAHEKELKAQHIQSIDIVVVNRYPFVETVGEPTISLDMALEQIDIGEAALIRAAARNFQNVVVLVRPQDYAPVLQEWREQGEISLQTRRYLAAIAFQQSASYDTAVATYLRGALSERFPEELTLALERIDVLRYGENPHQHAALYRWADRPTAVNLPTLADSEILHGKDLSYNNVLDLDAALNVVQSFTAPTVVIVKQTNPCGLACDDVLVEAYTKAHAADPVSAAGGVIGSNRQIDQATAQEISQLTYEAVIAPDFSAEALQILRKHKTIRLLATHCPIEPRLINTQRLLMGHIEVRTVCGGLLLQTPDFVGDGDAEYRVVSDREPTLEEITDLMFAWKVVRGVTSNAIVLAHKLMVVGVGAGQMNRMTSVHLAVEKASERARGAVLASDAFFPFADGIEAAAKAGITAIIQPGGSQRDEDAIRMANRYVMAMIFTGKRHFRH